MSFKHKFTWVTLVAFLVVPAIYFAVVLTQVQSTPVAQIVYQVPMMVAIGVSVVLIIVGAIATGIGTGIAIEITGNGSVDDIGKDDERDDEIERRGTVVGTYATATVMLLALVLAMLRIDQFWIANAIYLAFVAGTVTESIAKLVIYRRGF